MTTPMSRQESDSLAFKRADDEFVGRISEGSFNGNLIDVRQFGHLIEAAATNYSNFRCCHLLNVFHRLDGGLARRQASRTSPASKTINGWVRRTASHSLRRWCPVAGQRRDRTNRSNSRALPAAPTSFSFPLFPPGKDRNPSPRHKGHGHASGSNLRTQTVSGRRFQAAGIALSDYGRERFA